MRGVAAGWCTRKWFRLYQIIRKLNFGDLIIPLVVIRPVVPELKKTRLVHPLPLRLV